MPFDYWGRWPMTLIDDTAKVLSAGSALAESDAGPPSGPGGVLEGETAGAPRGAPRTSVS
jgi:hypothetical protein